MARAQTKRVHYWRDKKGHEVDLVLQRRGQGGPVAVECKWSANSAKTDGLAAFARAYPKADLYVVAPKAGEPQTIADRVVPVVDLKTLIQRLPVDLA